MSLIREHITEKKIKRKILTDKISRIAFKVTAILSASIVLFIIVFVAFKGMSPFIVDKYEQGNVNIFKFIFGMQWLKGAVGSSALYGIGFAIVNTLIAVFFAIIIAVPIAVTTALFIAKIAPKKIATPLRTVVELLAAIPSIIYGVFGLGVIAALVASLGGSSARLSFMTTVLVLALMILPTITVVSENAIRSVDKTMIEGSLALGASKMQTYFKVVLTSAKGGIFAGIILGVGRALGEATAVSMVSGNRFSGIALSPFDSTSTLTSRMLLGIKETTGLDYDIRFSVGLVLIGVILITNFLLKLVMKKVGNLDE